MKANEFDLTKSEGRPRLPNIDVEMSDVKGNKAAEADRILNDTDDVGAEEPLLLNEKQDEDELTNNSEKTKIPCSKFRIL